MNDNPDQWFNQYIQQVPPVEVGSCLEPKSISYCYLRPWLEKDIPHVMPINSNEKLRAWVEKRPLQLGADHCLPV